MQDEYLQFYILSYFDFNKLTIVIQIIYSFHAMRTTSIFFLLEVNGWHHGFSLTNKMTREQLSMSVRYLAENSYLIEKEKGYILTNKGYQSCREYFESHRYPQNIKSFANAKIRVPFWN